MPHRLKLGSTFGNDRRFGTFEQSYLVLRPPTLSWTTPISNNTPGFSGTVYDAQVSDTLILEWASDPAFATIMDVDVNDLDANEVGNAAIEFITGTFTNGAYWFRMRHARTGYYSSVSPIVAVTIDTRYQDTYLTAVNGGEQAKVVSSDTYDWDSPLQVGAADSRRRITLSTQTSGGSAATHASLTLYPTTLDRTNGTNGVSLTPRASTGTQPDTASTNYASVWDGDLPTGTSWYPRLVASAAGTRATIYGMTHSRPFSGEAVIEKGDGADQTLSATMNTPADGMAWFHTGVTSGSAVTCKMTGATKMFDGLETGTLYQAVGIHTNDSVADAGGLFESSWSGGSNHRMVVASYGAAV